MLVALMAALGVCNDLNTNCYTWMLDGQCENNTEYMHKNCPLSCSVCTGSNCSDTSDDCTSWAKSGECENNTAFMLRTCPTACGLCTPKCEDTHGGFQTGPNANETMCDKWARQGDCQGNPEFVLKHCPVTCGLCKPKCKDLHDSCPAWQAAGECTNNTNFMLKHCPASCNVCTSEPLHSHVTQANEILAASKEAVDKLMLGGGCHDVTEKAGKCKEWVESGECTTNPGFMLANCAHSCGLCTPVCADHAPDCPGWAQLKEGGECDENRYFMMTTCPASCGVCSELQKHLAANRKDEL